jgi:hypothetical protein
MASPFPLAAQADAVTSDRRIELFSILFRLAGAPEYSQGRVPAYAAAVDAYFAAHREHPAVTTTKAIRQKNVGFFHPMNLAVHLTPPPTLAERTAFDQPGHALGTRWPADQTRGYLEQVRAFYKDAAVDTFFAQQAALYDTANQRLRALVTEHGDPKWFAVFFAMSTPTRFFVVPAPLNGAYQYGATYRDAAGTQEAYAIMGLTKLDDAGMPRFDVNDADNVVHEFAHTLTNRAVDAHLAELAEAGPALFAPVRQQMREQAYGEWQTMIYESVVRAVVVRFLAAHRGAEAAAREIEAQEKSGFRQMAALARVLEEYERSRDRYRTFADVMPRIVDVFKAAAKG